MTRQDDLGATRHLKARIRIDGKWGGRAVYCGRCGLRLPDLACYPHVPPERIARDNPGIRISPNGCYVHKDDLPGWKLDGNTLRPTEFHKARRARTREKVRTAPSTQTRTDRRLLASRPPAFEPHVAKRFARRSSLEWIAGHLGSGEPTKHPAPQLIECPRCEFENPIDDDDLTTQRTAL